MDIKIPNKVSLKKETTRNTNEALKSLNKIKLNAHQEKTFFNQNSVNFEQSVHKV